MQLLASTGDRYQDKDNSHEARRWEPKRLRLRLFSTAARIARTGRRTIVHLAHDDAWTQLLLDGLTRLHARSAQLNEHNAIPTSRNESARGTDVHPRRHSGHCPPQLPKSTQNASLKPATIDRGQPAKVPG